MDPWSRGTPEAGGKSAAKPAAMETIVPAISSSVTGSLGVLHLPRLWLKHRLHAAGRLPEGYRHGPGGFDQMVTDALGVDHEAFAAYVERERPDYPTAEAWIRAHGTSVTPAAIADVNARIRAGIMPEGVAVGRRAELGLDASFELGVPLNDLDDWAALHRALTAP